MLQRCFVGNKIKMPLAVGQTSEVGQLRDLARGTAGDGLGT